MHQLQINILNNYQKNIDDLTLEIKHLKQKSFNYSMFRLGAILLLIVLMYLLIPYGAVPLTASIISCISIFLFAIAKQTDVNNLIGLQETKLTINQNEMDVLHLKNNAYFDGLTFKNNHHTYSEDLDVFGKKSLYHWLNRCRTFDGIHTLKDWLKSLSEKENLLNRIDATKEIESKPLWRQRFLSTLFDISGGEELNLREKLQKALSLDLNFANKKRIVGYVKLLPWIWLILIILYLFDLPLIDKLAGGLFLFNLFFVGRYTKQTTYIQNSLSKSTNLLTSISNALHLIIKEKWTTPSLSSLVNVHLDTIKSTETHSLQTLNKVIKQLDYRLNLLVGVTLNGLLLWDLKVLQNLHHWKINEEKYVYKVIEMVGYFEAITSLSTWSYHHPHCNYPIFSDNNFKLTTKNIHHPLIPSEESVGNDFQISPEDYISIITGSNMAGKSTFIRTIGANMVLAFAGTKPIAEHLECPIVNIVTYMRIKDALEENVSTFKAELNRIKLILSKIEKKEKCFFLIDEMLRGTNSKDKLNGSLAITKKLLQHQAYSIIATHDIKLAEMAFEFPNRIKNYYFDIDYKNDDLVFDYKIKNGICDNFNASFLLKKIGIDT